MKVCYVLSYYFPRYVRTATLLNGLQAIAEVTVYKAVNQHLGGWRYIESLLRLLWIRLRYDADLYILGFRGSELFWPVRFLTAGRPLIFDHMMSPYDSLVYETGKLKRGSLVEMLAYRYERAILRNADIVLADTAAHKRRFMDLFGLTESKLRVIHLAADETLFHPGVSGRSYAGDDFIVFFYGSFLPLHGMDTILDAAAALRDGPIRFVLVGGKRQNSGNFRRRLREEELTNVDHYDWVDYLDLPQWMAGADLCLGGPFGDTGQGRRIVTGKTLQCLAVGKPTVVGQTEDDYGFLDRENCLLIPQGDAGALTEAVNWGWRHREDLARIGRLGHMLYQERFSMDHLALQLSEILLGYDRS